MPPPEWPSILRQSPAHQQAGLTSYAVLAGSAGRAFAGRVAIHQSLALSHRVEDQGHDSFLRQADTGRLIIRRGLTLFVMPAGLDDGRARRRDGLGPIEIRRDVVLRPALEDHFFDDVIGACERPYNYRVERSALRQSADGRQQRAADALCQGAELPGRPHGLQSLAAARIGRVQLLHEVVPHHGAVAVGARNAGERRHCQ